MSENKKTTKTSKAKVNKPSKANKSKTSKASTKTSKAKTSKSKTSKSKTSKTTVKNHKVDYTKKPSDETKDAKSLETLDESAASKRKKDKPYSKGKKIRRVIFGSIMIYLTAVFIISYVWSLYAFTNLTIENMIFQLKVPVGGTEMSGFMDIILLDTLGALGIAAGIIFLYILFNLILGLKLKRKIKFNYKWFPRVTGVICLITFLILAGCMGVYTYIKNQITQTTLYSDYYVDPEYTEITFPEKKRNLVYIMLESMEVSFTDKSKGGIAADNYLPLLTELALENEDFNASSSDKLNGPIASLNTEWTVASYVAQTAGIPLSIPIERNAMNERKSFLPGAYSSFQILEENGYNQSLLIGSVESFSGLDVYIHSHGNTKLKGYNYFNKNNKLPYKDYYVWWGYEDRYLLEFAREEITELAKQDKPFAVNLMTIDTHRVGGYKCAKCLDKFDKQYSNVIACSDCQVKAFVDWIKKQSFYKDTTIVIVGDHPTMDGDYVYNLAGYNKSYQRKQYFTIINSGVEKKLDTDRTYTTMDIFPTFLAALGADIEGNKLGLGVNLYSEEPTLAETMGVAKLNKEIAKKSRYYEKYILYGNYKKH